MDDVIKELKAKIVEELYNQRENLIEGAVRKVVGDDVSKEEIQRRLTRRVFYDPYSELYILDESTMIIEIFPYTFKSSRYDHIDYLTWTQPYRVYV